MNTTHRQFAKYATVGLVSNVALYGVYLVLTNASIAPRTAMTVMYVVGVLATFLFNRNWTFENRGSRRAALVRYGFAYALGYIVNLIILTVMVDYLDYPHEVVQAILILFLAIFLFLAQKFWVFGARNAG